jgi:hypothetical protein
MPSRRLGLALALVLLAHGVATAGGRSALLVLGAETNPDGSPSPKLERRLTHALELSRRQPETLVLVTGAAVRSQQNEARTMASWLRQRGVEPERLLIEESARTSADNADLSVPLLLRAGVDHVTVVTERYHLPRTLFHVRAALRTVGAHHVVVEGAAAPDELSGLERLRTAAKERLKIARDLGYRLANGTLGFGLPPLPLPWFSHRHGEAVAPAGDRAP